MHARMTRAILRAQSCARLEKKEQKSFSMSFVRSSGSELFERSTFSLKIVKFHMKMTEKLSILFFSKNIFCQSFSLLCSMQDLE